MDNSAEKLGELIDKLTEKKLQYEDAQRIADGFSKEMKSIEEDIIHVMLEAKLEKAAHGGTQVAPKEHVYPNVEDWGVFGDFIIENRYLHLLERRVTVKGYRELLELGRQIPGVVPRKVTKLSVTKALR